MQLFLRDAGADEFERDVERVGGGDFDVRFDTDFGPVA